MKKNFQELNIQNVYAITLTFKIFRSFMTLMTTFDFEIRQLNAINAFFNAKNDESIYCFLSNNYKQSKKMMKMFRTLYDQKKSFFFD